MIVESRTSPTKLWCWKPAGNGYKGKAPLNSACCCLISSVFFCYVRRGLGPSCSGKGRGKRQPGAVARKRQGRASFCLENPTPPDGAGSRGGHRAMLVGEHGGGTSLPAPPGTLAGLDLSREMEAPTEDKTDTET